MDDEYRYGGCCGCSIIVGPSVKLPWYKEFYFSIVRFFGRISSRTLRMRRQWCRSVLGMDIPFSLCDVKVRRTRIVDNKPIKRRLSDEDRLAFQRINNNA